MNLNLHLIGTQSDRMDVIQAALGQLRELLYAMNEVGAQYVSINLTANASLPKIEEPIGGLF